MIDKPKVSIIIPVYNKEKYIRKTLDSVIYQTFRDYELIIVNDGSTDSSREIIDDYQNKDSRIKVINIPNGGVSNARNVGMENALGEWIWFVDADDEPNTEFLASIEPELRSNECDIIFAPFIKDVPNGDSQIVKTNITGDLPADRLLDAFMNYQYQNGFFGYLWCKVIRRTYIEHCRTRFEVGLTLAEDLKFMVSLYNNNPNCYFTDCLAMTYNSKAENSSSEKAIDYKAQLLIQYEILQWILNNYNKQYYLRVQDIICGYVAYIFIEAYELKSEFKEEILWLNNHQKYKELLDYSRLEGQTKTIIKLLKENKYKKLYKYFCSRTAVRNLYRKVIRK